MKKQVIVIIGPTASGKSDLAIQLAKKIDGEIISADSSQVYIGLDIGSAKIKEEEMQSVKHYMIDIKSAFEDFSVAEFKHLALGHIQQILDNKKRPIICGGTGLYVKSLVEDYDFANVPKSQNIRDEIEKSIDTDGLSNAYNTLCNLAPERAKHINPNDKVRIIRALEVCYSQKESVYNDTNEYEYLVYAIDIERSFLYQKINMRVDEMVKNGLFEEVKHLMDKGITINNSCFKSIGYKEIYDYYTNGNLDEIQTIELIKKKTRNYAKRQMTFFRGMKNIHWLRSDNKLKELLEDLQNKQNLS